MANNTEHLPETFNKFLVASGADTINILRPAGRLSRDEAINLAVYLVACSLAMPPHDHDPKQEFDELYAKVINT